MWHQLTGSIDITANGGLYYVRVWGTGRNDYWYHEWKFVSSEQAFAYIDWCDMYCDIKIHELLNK